MTPEAQILAATLAWPFVVAGVAWLALTLRG